jgi:hypothetical protein
MKAFAATASSIPIASPKTIITSSSMKISVHGYHLQYEE